MAVGRREYTPEQKAEGLRLSAEVGAVEASRRLDIPRGTLSAWLLRHEAESPAAPREPVPEMAWEERRMQFARDFTAAAVEKLEQARQTPNANSAKQLMVAAGVAFDKAAEIERRGADGRDDGRSGPQSTDELDRELDHELERLVEQRLSQLAARGDERARQAVTEAPSGLAADLAALTPAGEDAAKDAQRAVDAPPAWIDRAPDDPPLPPAHEQEIARARAELEHVEAELAALGAPATLPTLAQHRTSDPGDDWRTASEAIDDWNHRGMP